MRQLARSNVGVLRSSPFHNLAIGTHSSLPSWSHTGRLLLPRRGVAAIGHSTYVSSQKLVEDTDIGVLISELGIPPPPPGQCACLAYLCRGRVLWRLYCLSRWPTFQVCGEASTSTRAQALVYLQPAGLEHLTPRTSMVRGRDIAQALSHLSPVSQSARALKAGVMDMPHLASIVFSAGLAEVAFGALSMGSEKGPAAKLCTVAYFPPPCLSFRGKVLVIDTGTFYQESR
ncbi:uncharacterized protein B0I36DRAFT_28400 [Microdochium trichocladiopsis]|uniref:Uncharacterized protein n=1 Tax=Microdochium trichocladiopsis TaxID=1682393 RepID=A0A9P8XYV6_9PEZI|nr:uncharacterized protein B0I36DRAFT_28400 [Microdochium trichocladiopsis]KAH7021054.1 hypothetical protein B0I36DRAFT_28400 [Microdochium trichocladiopsis]